MEKIFDCLIWHIDLIQSLLHQLIFTSSNISVYMVFSPMHSYLFEDSELKKKVKYINILLNTPKNQREVDNLKQDDFEELSLEVTNSIIKMSV